MTDAIDNFPKLVENLNEETDEKTHSQLEHKKLYRIITKLIGEPSEQRRYHLFAVDCSTYPRPHAPKLSDRSSVYAPDQVPGNKPITIGHQYTNVVYLPEKTANMPPWVLPLLAQRVGHELDISLMKKLLDDEELALNTQFCVLTADTPHSNPHCRSQVAEHDNLVMEARIRGNTSTSSAQVAMSMHNLTQYKGKHRFGEKMNLRQTDTMRKPDKLEQFEISTSQGKQRTMSLEIWHNMRIPGTRDFRSELHPFMLVKISQLNSQGKAIHKKPMWLMVQGKRRDEPSPKNIVESYRQRLDIEHHFRFGKQRLLLDKFQTPDTEHEENCWQLVQLAYIQLYLAKEASQHLPYDWEKYLSEHQDSTTTPSPSQVMRDFPRIVGETGAPVAAPKPRGIPQGREKGQEQAPRADHAIVYKQPPKETEEKTSQPIKLKI